MNDHTERRPPKIAYLIWFLGALFFLLEYFIRVSPDVITESLMSDLNIGADMLGWLFGFFYYAYVLMQMPAGTLVDRFGPRRLLVGATLMCAVGCVMFAAMQTIHMGLLSRFVMGFSTAFAFVSTLKLVSIWFPPSKFALLAGSTQAMGMLGAVLGNAPIAYFFNTFGWRPTMLGIGVFFVLLSVMMYFIVSDDNPWQPNLKLRPKETQIKIRTHLKHVLANRYTLLNCLFIGLLYGPTASFGEQWGASFLSAAYGVTNTQAGAEISAIFIGLAIGCPLMGWISDKIQRRVLAMRISAIVSLVLLSLILYNNKLGLAPYISTGWRYVIFFFYGLFNTGIVPSYTYSSEINPHKLTGIALGVTNMASVILGAIFLPIIGHLLSWSAGFHPQLGPDYMLGDYQLAFSFLPLCLLMAFILSFTLRETYCCRVEDLESQQPADLTVKNA